MAAAAAGNITTSVNKGMRAGPMSGLLLLDVYDQPLLHCLHQLCEKYIIHTDDYRREMSFSSHNVSVKM